MDLKHDQRRVVEDVERFFAALVQERAAGRRNSWRRSVTDPHSASNRDVPKTGEDDEFDEDGYWRDPHALSPEDEKLVKESFRRLREDFSAGDDDDLLGPGPHLMTADDLRAMRTTMSQEVPSERRKSRNAKRSQSPGLFREEHFLEEPPPSSPPDDPPADDRQ